MRLNSVLDFSLGLTFITTLLSPRKPLAGPLFAIL
jgi:hypothetical protein